MQKVKRLLHLFFLRLITSSLPFGNRCRILFAKWGGVKLKSRFVHIGEGVIFDSLYPEEIEIGSHVHITMNCVILTHKINTLSSGINWEKGHVKINDGAFIGAGSIICNTVTIGYNSIIGAGSVVTKNVPDNEIWAGNPARFIKKRL